MKVLIAVLLFLNQLPPSRVGNLATPGCKSFREMYDRKDSEIMEKIKQPTIAYICFTPKTDEFTLISFVRLEQGEYIEKSSYISTAVGFSEIATYVDGVANYSTTLFGSWIAYGIDFAGATFDTSSDAEKEQDSRMQINPSEVDTFFSYKNSSNEKVTIAIKLRRSTLRFQKTFSFPVQGKPMQTFDTGYCAEFK